MTRYHPTQHKDVLPGVWDIQIMSVFVPKTEFPWDACRTCLEHILNPGYIPLISQGSPLDQKKCIPMSVWDFHGTSMGYPSDIPSGLFWDIPAGRPRDIFCSGILRHLSGEIEETLEKLQSGWQLTGLEPIYYFILKLNTLGEQ